MMGTSRHADTDTLWGPWEHGCQGLAWSSHSWQVQEWVRQGAWAKEEFRASQAYTLQAHQALRGGCRAVLTPGQYTHHPRCPHLIRTLQWVVDEVSLPMWMPGQCLGTTPILVRGPGGPRVGAMAAPAPRVEVNNTKYGDVTQVVVPPTIYETVHWGTTTREICTLYTVHCTDHRVVGERALKERAPTRKGIPGLRVWLARHSAVLLPLLRAPTPRWQAAPKDWVPSAVPAYPAEAVIGGRVAKTTTKTETVYHRGFAVKVTTGMKDAMEAENWAPELRVCCQPPDALPSDRPWIAITPAAVAKFKYPAECVVHQCPGHPYKGPLYYSLSTVGVLPAELHLALKTHLRMHHGDLALLAPHGLATDLPQVLAPNAEPGMWLHDLPALATLRKTIAAVDAGTTPAGMAMAGVAQSGHEADGAHIASGVGTAQEGEAMVLRPEVGRAAGSVLAGAGLPGGGGGPPYLPRGGPLWGWHAPPICQSWGAASPQPQPSMWSPCRRTGSHTSTSALMRRRSSHRSWTSHGSSTAPSPFYPQWPTGTNASFPPQRWATGCKIKPPFRHGSDMRPVGGRTTCREVASPSTGSTVTSSAIKRRTMVNIPTMIVPAHRSPHRNTVLDTTCLLCGAHPETAPHIWACSAQSHEWGPARRRLVGWLDQKVGSRAVSVLNQLWEPAVLEQCAVALRTPSMQRAHMEYSGPTRWGLSSYTTSSRSPSEFGTPTPRCVPHC